MIHLILLSGGSGSRLWPLSNSTRSKQFLKVLRDDRGKHISMVQRVYSQIKGVDADIDVTVATSASQKDAIERQLQGSYEIVVEPERRDTAPAIMLACSHLTDTQNASMNDTVIVMPIDSYADQGYFDSLKKLDQVIQSKQSDLALIGACPMQPTDKYGYILPDYSSVTLCNALSVLEFCEKPSVKDAAALIKKGALWNCGVFAFQLGWLIGVKDSYLPGADFDIILQRYSELPKNSFDYEVVESAKSVVVIPFNGSWKDLGTWNTLTEEMSDASSGDVAGLSTCEDTHVINELGLPLVCIGLKNEVVVATNDGILVSDKSESYRMKEFLGEAASARPMYERRRWGEYRVLDRGEYPDGNNSLTKELVLDEGCQFSYQIHRHRDEVWTVVSGKGEAVIDGDVREIVAGDSVKIPVNTLHSCRALNGQMRIIEVQMGGMLDEEDIERFGNWWS